MDSCVSTAMARERHGTANIALLHAGYGQLTQRREQRAFDDIANFYNVRERLIVQLGHFRAIGGAALTAQNNSAPQKEFGPPPPRGGASSLTYWRFWSAPFLSPALILWRAL